MALGFSGDVNHPEVLKELEKAVKKIIKAKKCAGCMVHSASDLRKFKDMGVQFMTYKVDSAIIYDAISQIRGEFDK